MYYCYMTKIERPKVMRANSAVGMAGILEISGADQLMLKNEE
jgi:hypothetical protein